MGKANGLRYWRVEGLDFARRVDKGLGLDSAWDGGETTRPVHAVLAAAMTNKRNCEPRPRLTRKPACFASATSCSKSSSGNHIDLGIMQFACIHTRWSAR